MKPNEQGWFSGVRRIASPNHDARTPGSEISLLVIHNISLPPDEFGGSRICEFFTNTLDCSAHPYFERLRELHVSAHFLIRRTGEIIQFVPCQRRAWHAGVSEWQGRSRCNDYSIGIELEGSDFVAFDPSQYRALARLTRQLKRHYPIRHIVGHSDIAPGRKTDPGPFFDWAHYINLAD
ncbi:MAG: 1,6-anhydro-N-acetylmuramyl-L-alanine amidase AmpD [Sideroxydans sp.]|nr:1,6-anhydro-N-acetylmuramyl-L-alanine amidase AmpD [Sideroxydans sp.]